MWLKKYLALARAGILEQLQYRLAMAVIVFGNIIYLTIIYFLWKAIFASSPTSEVSGMNFESTLIYLVLATALFNFLNTYSVWEIGRSIQSGKIVLDLLRPMEYRKYLFGSLIGSQIVLFFTTVLPTFVVVFFLTNGTIKLGINLFYFLCSVVLAIVISFDVDFLVGTICLYTESIWGINIMKEVIVLLFSGSTIPIAFFPGVLKKIALFMPFSSIYHAPLSILLNDQYSFAQVGELLLKQLIWTVVLTVGSNMFWNISVKKITVNGG